MGLSIIFVYRADDIRKDTLRPAELVMSPFHRFVQRELNSPVTIEERGN